LSRTEHRVTVEVHALDTPDQVLIGKATASALKLSSGRFALRAGLTSRVAQVSVSDKVGNKSMVLGSQIAQDLGISSGDVIRVAATQRRLRIGPYVGVLTAPQRKSAIPSRSFGRDTEYLRELCAAGKELGLIAFVLPYDAVNLRTRRVFGRVPEFRRGGRWHIREFPFPDVLFNRIPSRAHERSQQARRVINYALRQKSVHLFNQGFMDKWAVYAELSRHPDVRHMVPTTARFQGRLMLKSWLRRFGSVYLKPSSGSLGEGIVVVEQTPNGVVCWFRNRRQKPVSEKAPNVDRIYGRISRLIAGRRYLIQPDLRLLDVDGSPFDVRLLMQRNMSGKWLRTKMFARIARRGEYASNISRGGSGVPLDEVLARVRPKQAQRVLRDVRKAGEVIARAVESTSQCPVGELGIDIGIDRRLNLWLIEVNGKPHVDVVKPSTTDRAREASVRRPMEYAIYLYRNALRDGRLRRQE